MGLPRCGLGYIDDNVGRYACEIVSTREISSRADQRTCIPRRGTYDRIPDKGKVGGSSPPRPTINPSVYAAILAFAFFRNFPQSLLSTICQLPESPYAAPDVTGDTMTWRREFPDCLNFLLTATAPRHSRNGRNMNVHSRHIGLWKSSLQNQRSRFEG
jgi:hypothetical protein